MLENKIQALKRRKKYDGYKILLVGRSCRTFWSELPINIQAGKVWRVAIGKDWKNVSNISATTQGVHGPTKSRSSCIRCH